MIITEGLIDVPRAAEGHRVLSEPELAYCDGRRRPAEHPAPNHASTEGELG